MKKKKKPEKSLLYPEPNKKYTPKRKKKVIETKPKEYDEEGNEIIEEVPVYKHYYKPKQKVEQLLIVEGEEYKLIETKPFPFYMSNTGKSFHLD